MPLLMPYYMDYDLLLLAVPAVLLAAEWVRTPSSMTRADHWLLAAWAAVCLESYFNPGLAGHSRLNLMVPLIGVVAALMIGRCPRSRNRREMPIEVCRCRTERHSQDGASPGSPLLARA